MVDHLSDEFEFWIVTRDRDLGDTEAYSNIVANEWQARGNEYIFYVQKGRESVSFFRKLIRETPHDILYLNSFFDIGYTVKPLLGWHLSSAYVQRPLIVAPRGELSPSALRLKIVKKKFWLLFSNILRLYNKAIFQASSEFERSDISRALCIPCNRIRIAIDLPVLASLYCSKYEYVTNANACVSRENLNIVFLSRIAPVKNLRFAIKILGMVKRKVQFDIYGPIEDASYWAACKSAIAALPSNIAVFYKGAIFPEETRPTFARYDLFLFPTQGENYGHVIAESVSVGTPVLVSDQTPWRNLEVDGLGWDIALDSDSTFVDKIDSFPQLDDGSRRTRREAILQNAAKRIENPETILANRELFRSCL